MSFLDDLGAREVAGLGVCSAPPPLIPTRLSPTSPSRVGVTVTGSWPAFLLTSITSCLAFLIVFWMSW